MASLPSTISRSTGCSGVVEVGTASFSTSTALLPFLITFTFSHLADAFIQSDLHMCDLQCIHILHFYIYTDGTLHIRSNLGFSVLLKDASTGNRTSNLLITK